MTKKVHHQTRAAANKALEVCAITEQSHAAVLAGEMSLQEARNIGVEEGPSDTSERHSDQGTATETAGRASQDARQGRADAPPQPLSRISKDDTTQECWCGCQELTSPGKRWRPGHDQRAKGIIRRAVKEGKVGKLSPQLKEYGKERGLLR